MRSFLTALIVLFTLLWLPARAQDARGEDSWRSRMAGFKSPT